MNGGWDLMASLEAPSCARIDESVGSRLDISVLNSAAFTLADTVQLGVYLSTDAQIDTSDTPLDGTPERIGPLAVGNSEITLSEDVSIPGSLAPGPYELGVIADAGDKVREPDEDNNTAKFPIWIAEEGEACPPATPEPVSAYSTFDTQHDCEVQDAPPPDAAASWVRLKCPGWGEYPVHIAQDDQRVSVDYGFVGDGRAAWNSFQSFNRVYRTVEWRLAPGPDAWEPFAAIHRWFVAGEGGEERPVLVVSTVAQRDEGASCPAGYVDARANAHANRLAREVADAIARRFECGEHEARFYGGTEPQTPQPVFAPGGE